MFFWYIYTPPALRSSHSCIPKKVPHDLLVIPTADRVNHTSWSPASESPKARARFFVDISVFFWLLSMDWNLQVLYNIYIYIYDISWKMFAVCFKRNLVSVYKIAIKFPTPKGNLKPTKGTTAGALIILKPKSVASRSFSLVVDGVMESRTSKFSGTALAAGIWDRTHRFTGFCIPPFPMGILIVSVLQLSKFDAIRQLQGVNGFNPKFWRIGWRNPPANITIYYLQ